MHCIVDGIIVNWSLNIVDRAALTTPIFLVMNCERRRYTIAADRTRENKENNEREGKIKNTKNNKRNEWAEDASVWRLRVTLFSLALAGHSVGWFISYRRTSRFHFAHYLPFTRTLPGAIGQRILVVPNLHSRLFSLWTESTKNTQATSGDDDAIPSVLWALQCIAQWDSNLIFQFSVSVMWRLWFSGITWMYFIVVCLSEGCSHRNMEIFLWNEREFYAAFGRCHIGLRIRHATFSAQNPETVHWQDQLFDSPVFGRIDVKFHPYHSFINRSHRGNKKKYSIQSNMVSKKKKLIFNQYHNKR